jgi:hypothetical protein
MNTVQFKFPCSAQCVCLTGGSTQTKSIRADLRIKTLNAKATVVRLQGVVPIDIDQFFIYHAFQTEGEKFALSQGAVEATVFFRPEGEIKVISWTERLRDFWFAWTGRGAPIVRRVQLDLRARASETKPSYGCLNKQPVVLTIAAA